MHIYWDVFARFRVLLYAVCLFVASKQFKSTSIYVPTTFPSTFVAEHTFLLKM